MEKTITDAFASQGPAWVLVGLTILGAWRVTVWLKPWAEKLITAHLVFIGGIDAKFAEVNESLHSLTEAVDNLDRRGKNTPVDHDQRVNPPNKLLGGA